MSEKQKTNNASSGHTTQAFLLCLSTMLFVHSKSIQVQSCKGNTTGPKGRDAGGGGQILKKQSQGQSAAPPSWEEIKLCGIGSNKNREWGGRGGTVV